MFTGFRCPHCKVGKVFLEDDWLGSWLTCFSCGWTRARSQVQIEDKKIIEEPLPIEINETRRRGRRPVHNKIIRL